MLLLTIILCIIRKTLQDINLAPQLVINRPERRPRPAITTRNMREVADEETLSEGVYAGYPIAFSAGR